MGKRVAISQPTVIQTELRPLDESFWIDSDNQLEQWYYQNTDVFMPDRQIAPLTLTPKLSALDPDANNGQGQTYEPNFVISKWTVKEWNGTSWVTRDITSKSQGDDYYIVQKKLKVRKNNYDAAHAININCKAYYVDPRDNGVTCWVEARVMLTTSVDATQVYPTIEIKNPSARAFNPLKDDPIYEFEATADWSGLDTQGGMSITEYKVDPLGMEAMLPTNEDMVLSAEPLLDIRYGDTYIEDAQGNHVMQQFSCRQVSGGLVNPIVSNIANITDIKGYTKKILQNSVYKLVSFGGYEVDMNQLVKNGNFENKDNWTSGSATFSVGNNIASLLSKAQYGNIKQPLTLISGHKYYLVASVKPTSSSPNMRIGIGNPSHYTGEGVVLNIYSVTNTNSFTKLSTCATFTKSASDTGDDFLNIMDSRSSGFDTLYVKNVFLVDVTQMFGAGYEPNSAWCDANFTQDYYQYCPSFKTNVMSISGTRLGVKSVGFNLWDEEWEVGTIDNSGNVPSTSEIRSKNYIDVEAGKTYYMSKQHTETGYWILYEYDANKNVVGSYTKGFNHPFTVGNNTRFIRFYTGSYGTTYMGDLCLNISYNGKNGQYEPHWKSVSDMSWVNKLGIENFNLWDEEWEVGSLDPSTGVPSSSTTEIRSKNFIEVDASQAYCMSTENKVAIFWALFTYDENKNFIASFTKGYNSVITFNNQNVKYIRFATGSYGNTYLNDLCFNKSISYFNGRYVPYGETALYFPNGMCNANSVYDEVYVDTTNKKIKGVVRFVKEDLGNLDWEASVDRYRARLGSKQTQYAYNGICSKYPEGTSSEDKVWFREGEGQGFNIIIKDSSYTSVSLFKEAMKGVQFIYELETPYVFEIDYPTKGEFEWYGVDSSGEVKIETLPCYQMATQKAGYGQGTSKININALYGEDISVILRMKRFASDTTPMPMKVTKSVAWKIPPLSVVVVSDKGSAVRAQNQSSNFTFSTIVNQQGEVIPDDVKQANMTFAWFYQKFNVDGTAQNPVSLGSGLTKTVAASTLKNTRPNNGSETPSTNVYCEASVLGAYYINNGQYVRD